MANLTSACRNVWSLGVRDQPDCGRDASFDVLPFAVLGHYRAHGWATGAFPHRFARTL